MPLWFLRVGWVLCGVIALASVGRAIESGGKAGLHETAVYLLATAYLVWADRDARRERAGEAGGRAPGRRDAVLAVGLLAAAALVVSNVDWHFRSPGSVVALFLALWFAFSALGFGARFLRGSRREA